MTLQAAGDQVTVAAVGLKLEGGIRDGKIELERPGKDGPPMRMTGTVEQGGMSGDFTMGTTTGRWKATRIPVRPPNAPREHVFEPKEFHRVFSGAIPPVLHIYPGDTVKTWSVDAGGVDAKGVRRSLGGNPQTGPFYIEGALPGDTLVVKLKRIRLNRDTAISTGSIAANAITPDYAAEQEAGGELRQRLGAGSRKRSCQAGQTDRGVEELHGPPAADPGVRGRGTAGAHGFPFGLSG